MPSEHVTGAPAGHDGHALTSGAHHPGCGQHVVPEGQHDPLHGCAHAQTPAPPWQVPLDTQLESPQQ